MPVNRTNVHIQTVYKVKVECNLYIDDRLVQINADPNETGDAKIRYGSEFTLNENAAIALIAEILRELSDGKDMDRFFDPSKSQVREDRLMKCMWTASGFVQVIDPDASRHHHHATTVLEAMSRNRTFTVMESVYVAMNKSRPTKNKTISTHGVVATKGYQAKKKQERIESIRREMQEIDGVPKDEAVELPIDADFSITDREDGSVGRDEPSEGSDEEVNTEVQDNLLNQGPDQD